MDLSLLKKRIMYEVKSLSRTKRTVEGLMATSKHINTHFPCSGCTDRQQASDTSNAHFPFAGCTEKTI